MSSTTDSSEWTTTDEGSQIKPVSPTEDQESVSGKSEGTTRTSISDEVVSDNGSTALSDRGIEFLALEVRHEEALTENEDLIENLRNANRKISKLTQEKSDLTKSSDYLFKQLNNEKDRTRALDQQLGQAWEQLRIQQAENSHLFKSLETLTNQFDEQRVKHHTEREEQLDIFERLKDDRDRACEDSDGKDMTIKFQAEQIYALEQDLRASQEMFEEAQVDILDLRHDIDEVELLADPRSPARIILRKPPVPNLANELADAAPEEQSPLFQNLIKSIWQSGRWLSRDGRASNTSSRQGSNDQMPIFRADGEQNSAQTSADSPYLSHSSAIPSSLKFRRSVRFSLQEDQHSSRGRSLSSPGVSPLSSPFPGKAEDQNMSSSGLTGDRSEGYPSETPDLSSPLRSQRNLPQSTSTLPRIEAQAASAGRSAQGNSSAIFETAQMLSQIHTPMPCPVCSGDPSSDPARLTITPNPTQGIGLGIANMPGSSEDIYVDAATSPVQPVAEVVPADQTSEEERELPSAHIEYAYYANQTPSLPGRSPSAMDGSAQADLVATRGDEHSRKSASTDTGGLSTLLCVLAVLLCVSWAFNAYFMAYIMGLVGRTQAWSQYGAFGFPGCPYDHWSTRLRTDIALQLSRLLGTGLLSHT